LPSRQSPVATALTSGCRSSHDLENRRLSGKMNELAANRELARLPPGQRRQTGWPEEVFDLVAGIPDEDTLRRRR